MHKKFLPMWNSVSCSRHNQLVEFSITLRQLKIIQHVMLCVNKLVADQSAKPTEKFHFMSASLA